MQSLHTRIAMIHADLSLALVQDHLVNMGGIIGEVEMDAYLHGIMRLAAPERDCVAQAVNELLDDLVMTGDEPCCRAPYSYGVVPDGRGVTCTAGGARIGGPVGSPAPSPFARIAQPVPLPLLPGTHRKR